ncbi:hypothetical protein [Stieleria mannarensis]|uniref:hypothetical protein n=1 Tax=Stieleria mannarensis TaxID=2755585 RepID=UPI0015FFD8BF|nr:hypothetical protein [Rhodopirellula sp. JC639]
MTDSENRSNVARFASRWVPDVFHALANVVTTKAASPTGLATAARLATAAVVLTATPLVAQEGVPCLWRSSSHGPTTTDPTATIVRVAPRILISKPAESDVMTRDRDSQVTLAALHRRTRAVQVEQFESLPSPSDDQPGEGQGDEPVLGQPVPLTPPTLLPVPDNTPRGSIDPFDDGQPELIESDVLDLGEIPPVPEAAEDRSVDYPAQSGGAWLDIRPRGIGPFSRELVADADLPDDTSGLAQEEAIPQLVMLHRADLNMRDFWGGASFCHRPLYFEDNRLERYGAIRGPLCRAPALHSGLHFAWKAGVLPVSAAIDPPCNCVRSGYHTPPLKRLIK